MNKIIIDTDIGSDVDDALAVSMLLGTSQVEVLGITTVYGDTKLRAQIAMHICSLLDKNLPIYPGVSNPISGREVWMTGQEGRGLENLFNSEINKKSAIDFLVESVNNKPNQIEILAIGPLTNIATAINSSNNFAENVKCLWIMGGDFISPKSEHNFKCDSSAAKIVIESDFPIYILDLPSSQKTIIRKAEIDEIRRIGKIGDFLYEEIMKWIIPRSQDWTIPHDPIAALGIVLPNLFEFSSSGKVEIDGEGRSTWHEMESGNVRRIWPKNPEVAVQQMIKLIAANN